MLLSSTDIERLERLGHDRQKFVRYDKHGFARLKNRHGLCVFYDSEECCCQIYGHRPLGCRIYPVIYSEQEGIVVDGLCPMYDTVSKTELRREGKKLMELLQRIDNEAHARKANERNSGELFLKKNQKPGPQQRAAS
jgi:Fe-S-cluster containining protein